MYYIVPLCEATEILLNIIFGAVQMVNGNKIGIEGGYKKELTREREKYRVIASRWVHKRYR